jgi:hypothetical protein
MSALYTRPVALMPYSCIIQTVSRKTMQHAEGQYRIDYWHYLKQTNPLSKAYHWNRPWKPIWLWDVEATTFSKQSACRWWWSLTYTKARLPLPLGRFLVFISARGWVGLRAILRMVTLGKFKKFNDLIGILTCDLPACSIVSQPTTLPRSPAK